MLISDGWGFFLALSSVYSESVSKMGEGKRRCRSGSWDEEAGGVHMEHLHIPTEIAVRGGGRLSIRQPPLHMSQTSIFSSSKGL